MPLFLDDLFDEIQQRRKQKPPEYEQEQAYQEYRPPTPPKAPDENENPPPYQTPPQSEREQREEQQQNEYRPPSVPSGQLPSNYNGRGTYQGPASAPESDFPYGGRGLFGAIPDILGGIKENWLDKPYYYAQRLNYPAQYPTSRSEPAYDQMTGTYIRGGQRGDSPIPNLVPPPVTSSPTPEPRPEGSSRSETYQGQGYSGPGYQTGYGSTPPPPTSTIKPDVPTRGDQGGGAAPPTYAPTGDADADYLVNNTVVKNMPGFTPEEKAKIAVILAEEMRKNGMTDILKNAQQGASVPEEYIRQAMLSSGIAVRDASGKLSMNIQPGSVKNAGGGATNNTPGAGDDLNTLAMKFANHQITEGEMTLLAKQYGIDPKAILDKVSVIRGDGSGSSGNSGYTAPGTGGGGGGGAGGNLDWSTEVLPGTEYGVALDKVMQAMGYQRLSLMRYNGARTPVTSIVLNQTVNDPQIRAWIRNLMIKNGLWQETPETVQPYVAPTGGQAAGRLGT